MATKKRVLKEPTRKRDSEKDIADWRKEAREGHKALEALTTRVRAFVVQLDELMQQPSTVERGRAVSKLLNALEMANDHVRYFTLHVDYRRDKPMPIDVARQALVPMAKGAGC